MSSRRPSRAERNATHERRVADEERVIRDAIRRGERIYADEHRRKAVREGNTPRVEALDGMRREINRHNREQARLGNDGSTRRRVADVKRDIAREEYEGRRERDVQRARRTVEENARTHGGKRPPAPDGRAGNAEFAKRRRRTRGRHGGSLG